MTNSRKFMIVAGEASGDRHAAKLVNALRETEVHAQCEFFGAAGPRMRDAGVEPIVLSDRLSIVGIAEIGRALPMFLRAAKDLKKAAIDRKPDAVILVDFPDFNLKLAKSLKKQGFTVIYYISPQLWAWRKYRISIIKRYVDLLLTILPFEKQWYEEQGVTHVEYVGSPLAREVVAGASKVEFCESQGLDPSRPIVALLPGSRHKEIVRILPVMIDAAKILAEEVSGVQYVIAAADEGSAVDIAGILALSERPVNFNVIGSRTYDLLAAADVAAVTSGTATLEAGIIGTPMAIVYKTSRLNYKLLEPMINVPHYGLINLIAGERVAIELIQDDLTPESLSGELFRLLEPAENNATRKRLNAAAEKLGHGGASKRAAEAIIRTLNGRM
jgi:lipid-A-disaccharide synthase